MSISRVRGLPRVASRGTAVGGTRWPAGPLQRTDRQRGVARDTTRFQKGSPSKAQRRPLVDRRATQLTEQRTQLIERDGKVVRRLDIAAEPEEYPRHARALTALDQHAHARRPRPRRRAWPGAGAARPRETRAQEPRQVLGQRLDQLNALPAA
jgi:hypothetical protein